MRPILPAAMAAAFLLTACGGGQTDTTEAEDALANEFQPAAPSPGGFGNAVEAGTNTAFDTDAGNVSDNQSGSQNAQ